MGMSLFISGAAPEPGRVEAITEFATQWAQENEWLVEPMERHFEAVSLNDAPPCEAGIVGITLLPHVGCESLPLHFFGPQAILVDSVLEDRGDAGVRASEGALLKTLFAGQEAHQEICAFLRELRERHLPSLVVDDESGFFGGGSVEALAAAHRAGWEHVRAACEAPEAAEDDAAEVGGFVLLRSERGKGSAPFARVPRKARELLESLAAALEPRYGGMGLKFGDSAEGLLDLDLLMDEADEQGLGDALESEEAEQLVHCVGAGFGSALIALHGGCWVKGDEGGFELAELGRVGMRLDPFQCAVDRLVEGPVHSFRAYSGIVAEFSRQLA